MAKYIDIGTIGDYLRDEWILPNALSGNRVALAIGVPANRITDIIGGRRGITADTDLRLCRYFGMSDGHFLRMQDYINTVLARRELADELSSIVPYANDNVPPKNLMAM